LYKKVRFIDFDATSDVISNNYCICKG